ncbi:basic proline-rich protein-like [Trichosurus vulpecula]|uniref:basic proline-rich protein-like n=1 Tax=Trichosurus vulpecula TaxID=9337 RepID=UPI00186AD60C|nr:basic proline-rich protein-like [Trichosurus vulpecula]
MGQGPLPDVFPLPPTPLRGSGSASLANPGRGACLPGGAQTSCCYPAPAPLGPRRGLTPAARALPGKEPDNPGSRGNGSAELSGHPEGGGGGGCPGPLRPYPTPPPAPRSLAGAAFVQRFSAALAPPAELTQPPRPQPREDGGAERAGQGRAGLRSPGPLSLRRGSDNFNSTHLPPSTAAPRTRDRSPARLPLPPRLRSPRTWSRCPDSRTGSSPHRGPSGGRRFPQLRGRPGPRPPARGAGEGGAAALGGERGHSPAPEEPAPGSRGAVANAPYLGCGPRTPARGRDALRRPLAPPPPPPASRRGQRRRPRGAVTSRRVALPRWWGPTRAPGLPGERRPARAVSTCSASVRLSSSPSGGGGAPLPHPTGGADNRAQDARRPRPGWNPAAGTPRGRSIPGLHAAASAPPPGGRGREGGRSGGRDRAGPSEERAGQAGAGGLLGPCRRGGRSDRRRAAGLGSEDRYADHRSPFPQTPRERSLRRPPSCFLVRSQSDYGPPPPPPISNKPWAGPRQPIPALCSPSPPRTNQSRPHRPACPNAGGSTRLPGEEVRGVAERRGGRIQGVDFLRQPLVPLSFLERPPTWALTPNGPIPPISRPPRPSPQKLAPATPPGKSYVAPPPPPC